MATFTGSVRLVVFYPGYLCPGLGTVTGGALHCGLHVIKGLCRGGNAANVRVAELTVGRGTREQPIVMATLTVDTAMFTFKREGRLGVIKRCRRSGTSREQPKQQYRGSFWFCPSRRSYYSLNSCSYGAMVQGRIQRCLLLGV